MSENFEPLSNSTNESNSSVFPHREESGSSSEYNFPSARVEMTEEEADRASAAGLRVSPFSDIRSSSYSSSARVANSTPRTVGGMASTTSGIENNSHRSKTHPRARRMSLSLVKVDAWSVAKVTFLLSVAGGIIQVIAAGLVWLFLNMVGVFDQVTQIVSSTGLDSNGLNLADVFSLPTVLSAVTILSIVEIVIITILSAITALLYNVVGALVGGIHVTLGDD